jgi:hypothetical protein
VPQFGRLDVTRLSERIPVVRELAREAWETDTRVLNFSYELDDSHALELLPPALHPSIPLWGNLMLREHATSPVGPFALAELRVIGRAGVHPGGYTFGAFATTDEAVAFLRESYGWPVRRGEVRIERRHDATFGSVRAEGRSVLDAALERAEPISPGDVLYHVSFHLARVGGDVRLVQAEPRYTPASAERGTPRVRAFEPEAFGEPRAKLVNPLPATAMTGRVELRPVRWLIDPLRPAVVGSTRVGGRE